MRRMVSTRFVEPEQAMAAFRKRFSHVKRSDLERLIILASHPVEVDVPAVAALRMLMDFGFSREDLLATLHRTREPLLSDTNPYEDQAVESIRGYRTDWDAPDVVEKAARLHQRIGIALAAPRNWGPCLKPQWEYGTLVSPGVLGRHFGVSDPLGYGHQQLLVHLAEVLRQTLISHGFDGWSSMLEVCPFERLELHPLAREALTFLDDDREHGSSCLVFPAQFGRRWRGSSMERAAWHMERSAPRIGIVWKEFPLMAYAVLCELIADPERIVRDGILAIDCPGDVLTDTRGVHTRSGPCFLFQNERLHVIPRARQSADAECGSASGLIPLVR